MSLIWSPPVELSPAEQRILNRCKKSKLFIFLRMHRQELFSPEFQAELAAMYAQKPRGSDIVPPALLAMATLLQAWFGLSDDDTVEAAEMDRRWQMLLGSMDSDESPFSQGSLFNFRQRLIAHDLDRRLLDRTVELARTTRGFGHRALRAAFDSSPLFGAGRVEDTFNLLGHAMRDLLSTVAKRLGVDFEEACQRVGVSLFRGSSLKAALDCDWDDPVQKKGALHRLLSEVQALEAFLARELNEELTKPPLAEQLATIKQIVAQDTEPDPDGGGARIREGVAKERLIRVSDKEMRHGRKSKSQRIDGYKRHLAVDLNTKLVLSVAVTPANRPEGEAAEALFKDIERQGFAVDRLVIDRAYLLDEAVEVRRFWDMEVCSKAPPLNNHGRYTKAEFRFDFTEKTITCPAGQSVPLVLGQTARFLPAQCSPCTLREHCTVGNGKPRTVSIHKEEEHLVELRRRQKTPEGREALRRRTGVEHRLSHVGRSQGPRARYRGTRKNEFDLRRHAALANLHVAAAA